MSRTDAILGRYHLIGSMTEANGLVTMVSPCITSSIICEDQAMKGSIDIWRGNAIINAMNGRSAVSARAVRECMQRSCRWSGEMVRSRSMMMVRIAAMKAYWIGDPTSVSKAAERLKDKAEWNNELLRLPTSKERECQGAQAEIRDQ